MDNLSEVLADKITNGNPDSSANVWAARVFAVLYIFGSRDNMVKDDPEKIVEAIHDLLAKAPTSVIAGGTMKMLTALAERGNFGKSE